MVDNADQVNGSISPPLITTFGRSHVRSKLSAALLLDRDGVLVEDRGHISAPENLHILPNVIDVLQQLQVSFRLIIITNQSGVARGYFSEKVLYRLHEALVGLFLNENVGIDAIYHCPHHPTEGLGPYRRDCHCRKPKPGLFHAAAKQFHLNLGLSITIGDKVRDIEAGRAAGTRTLFFEGASKSEHVKHAFPNGTIKRFDELLPFITT